MINQRKNIISIFYIIIISSIIFTFQSCAFLSFKNRKNFSEKEKNNIEIKSILDSLEKNTLKFKTFYSGFSGNFEQNGKNTPLKGIIKIKKDTFIQISIRPALGIELAKIELTKDSIKFIDRIKKEYFKGDYNFAKNKFGIDLDYRIIESIFINRYFVYPKNEKILDYTFARMQFPKNAQIFLSLGKKIKYNGKIANHTLIFIQNEINLKSNNFRTFDLSSTINISYSRFNKIDKIKFPKNIQIKLFENSMNYNISISYKNISINKRLNSNFVIPKNYKQAKFEK